jgi:hypothetical protein
MSEKRPAPRIPTRARSGFPVSSELSYSRDGVHPQCSVRQADEKRKNRIKRETLLLEVEKTPMPASGIAPWQKYCPKCNTLQHVRKTACGCGHTFTARARPPTREGERT